MANVLCEDRNAQIMKAFLKNLANEEERKKQANGKEGIGDEFDHNDVNNIDENEVGENIDFNQDTDD